MRNTTKFQFTKFGIKGDPRGAHVTLSYSGQTLLGEVIGAYYREVTGSFLLNVRHLNGEMWPLDPSALDVNVLVRR